MTSTTRTDLREQSVAIFLDELTADEEFRDAFLRNPRKALRLAADWLPLSESEIQMLIAAAPSIRDRIADELEACFEEAA